MIQRRKTSERKAATQALQVIAESIRACRGRGGRPTSSTPKLETMIRPILQRSKSDMAEKDDVINISGTDGNGSSKETNHYNLTMKKNMATRRDSYVSAESMGSNKRSKSALDKENMKPTHNGFANKKDVYATITHHNDTKLAPDVMRSPLLD